MENQLKSSIIIRAHNSEETLDRAINSALSQDMPRKDYEVIVINDGSSDRTGSIADSFVRNNIRLIHQANQGAVASANRGFREARGEYVMLLDSDDECLPELLTRTSDLLDNDPMLAFCYCDYFEETAGSRKEMRINDVFQMIAGGTLWRKSFGDAHGWFLNAGIFPEYELVLRTWGRYKFAHISKPLYVYHRSGTSLTGDVSRVQSSIARLNELYPERKEEIARIRSYILPS